MREDQVNEFCVTTMWDPLMFEPLLLFPVLQYGPPSPLPDLQVERRRRKSHLLARDPGNMLMLQVGNRLGEISPSCENPDMNGTHELTRPGTS